ncbi:MAG: adenosine deaminase [Bdellovibrionaceae bacterium]|jgi:adenosine deaminase|nr:adenosine deaminase [Pseudobdellovibrionaceae bacterium]
MDFKNIAKTELHRHLELSIRQSTIKELAPLHGIELPNEKAFSDRFLITEPMADLGSVLNKFLDTQLLLSTEEILERVAYEACEDAYNEGIRILELRYAPTFVIREHDNLTFDSIHAAFVKGVEKAEKDFPMAVGLMAIIQRILPVADAESVTDFAINHKDTFIGLDLADNEVGFDSKPFASFFQRAKKAGLGISVHSGEADVPKAPEYVKDAIEFLGATRIGHGLQVYKSEEMMTYIKDNNITLELCPTSNLLTNAVKNIEDHPFKKLYDFGIRTTINTDDPGIFNLTLDGEYKLIKDLFDFTESDFSKCNDFAAHASFIAHDKKQKVWPRDILK